MDSSRFGLSAARVVPLAALALFLAAPIQAQETLLTVAEASDFTKTSLHEDVLEFVAKLQGSSPLVRVETMATSAEGRPLPLVILGDPAPTSPADLRYDDRAVVYIQANIHAGEVEGKEAALMLARDIVRGLTADYLEDLVILLCPNFNPDGNEKISTRNRTNQVGPDGGVGIRYNGQNLDLNRDGMKLESPEAAGLVENVLRRWDPVFFLDSHTHNGSYHQEPVTWTWGLNSNGDPGIFSYMADVVLPDITRRTREDYGFLTIPHGDFIDVNDPGAGWIPLGPQPRYLSNYVGLRNRLSILNEQYPYVDFRERVFGAYNLFRTFLDYLQENKEEVVALVRDADRRTVERGASADPGEFAVEFDPRPIDFHITIEGYEMEIVQEEGRRPRARPTETLRTYDDVPYLADWTPIRTVTWPNGYLITAQDRDVVDKLLQHGIAVERLMEPVNLTVEQFSVSEATGSPRLNQGHYNTSVTGEYSDIEKEFAEGTYFVTTAQPLGAVAVSLLEPESDDGMVYWNFFDRYLAAQWSAAAQVYPVYKLKSPVNLLTEIVGK